MTNEKKLCRMTATKDKKNFCRRDWNAADIGTNWGRCECSSGDCRRLACNIFNQRIGLKEVIPVKAILKGLTALMICGALNFGLTTDAQAADLNSIDMSAIQSQDVSRHHHHRPPPPHDYGPPPRHGAWGHHYPPPHYGDHWRRTPPPPPHRMPPPPRRW